MYKVVITKDALKDLQKLKSSNLENKAKSLVEILKNNPFKNPPSYEKLIGDLDGLYLRRINIKHRLVYEIDEDNKTIKIVSIWPYYGDN